MTANVRAAGEDQKEKRKTEEGREEELEVKRVVDTGQEVVLRAVLKIVMK